jgi:hypothetical protein
LSWCRELGAALLLLLPALAQAQALTVTGEASTRLEAISNPSFAVPAEGTALRFTTGLQATAAVRDEARDAVLTVNIARHFSGNERLDNTDRGFQYSLARRFERDTLAGSVGMRRDSTLASELATTGIALTRTQRDSDSADLNWEHQLTERITTLAGVTLSALRYDRSHAAGGLIDSDVASANAGLRYSLGARTTASASLSVSHLDTNPFTTRSQTESAQLSLTHAPSDRLSLNAAYGPSRTRSEVASSAAICPAPQIFCDVGLVPRTVFPTTVHNESSGYLYAFGASWQAGARSTLSGNAARTIVPSGAGFVSQTDALTAGFNHSLTEQLTLTLDAAHSRAQAVGGLIPSRTVTRRLGARLDWRLAERWWAEAGAFQQQIELLGGASPRSNTVFIGLRYGFREQRL